MDFAYTPEDEAFRSELREWLDKALAAFEEREIPDVVGQNKLYEKRKAWQKVMAEGGWAAINWPKELGGREATLMQNVIYSQEMAKSKAPGIYNANGVWQIGPMIIRWGTQEQKDRWLHGILYAEEHWCQGFSEPEAGSDLANLRLLAIRDGDDYVLDGQKIWITTAHIAKWGLFLVRTDPTAMERGAKHDGITALIVDMETPGITATPITDIVGEDSFCLVTFDQARVPADFSRLGNEGEGWMVAMGTLTNERVGTAGLSITMKAELDRAVDYAREHNPQAISDPDLRDRLARAYTQIEMTRLLNMRALSKVLKGEKGWPEVQIAKLQWSHLAQTLAELQVDLLGPAALLARGGPDAVDKGSWSRLYSYQRYTSIGAGTTQVQKNIIADRAIKLPRK
ncbi:MAG TPA: acyl-CoA dehydrogenase family protein [Mycobacteriales bacterium]|nr:acyl-CoA dehydrogenase family protein [Mycobacteriales bacterium]